MLFIFWKLRSLSSQTLLFQCILHRHHHSADHDHSEHQRPPFITKGLLRHRHGLVHRRLLRVRLFGPHRVRGCQLFLHLAGQQGTSAGQHGLCCGHGSRQNRWRSCFGNSYLVIPASLLSALHGSLSFQLITSTLDERRQPVASPTILLPQII